MNKICSMVAGLALLVMASISAYGMTHNEYNGHETMNMHHDMATMTEPLKELRGKEFDRAFYSMMIPHHQGAVEMSEKILKTTKNLQVRKWAEAIIVEQNTEIGQMANALKELGGMDSRYADMMKMDMTNMVENTKNDGSYVRLMVPHHQSAVDMAELVRERSEDPELLELASRIIKSQSGEIEEFQHWLTKHS